MLASYYSDGLDALANRKRSAIMATDYRDYDKEIEFPLTSILDGVSDEAWTAFVTAMATAPLDAVTDHNALGTFGMKPRRLADLGIAHHLARATVNGKTIYAADFVPPMTSDLFLSSPRAQYAVFSASISRYSEQLANGEIDRGGLSWAAALAVLHKAGPAALGKPLFASTQELVAKVEGLF